MIIMIMMMMMMMMMMIAMNQTVINGFKGTLFQIHMTRYISYDSDCLAGF